MASRSGLDARALGSSRGDPSLPAPLGRTPSRASGPCAASDHSGDELAVGACFVLALPLRSRRSESEELAIALADKRAIERFRHLALEQLDV
jgi:hypothetical protein